MSYCELNLKADYSALITFVGEHPWLLAMFFILQIASGVALEKATRSHLSFIQRLMLATITTSIVFLGKDYLSKHNTPMGFDFTEPSF